MAIIDCEIEYTSETNEEGREQDCVVATCSECGKTATSWGHGETSVKRGLVMLRAECGAENFYQAE